MNSESFLFKTDREKLYLIGVCLQKKYLKYYCFNINRYKKFIKDTINSFKLTKLTNRHWNDMNMYKSLNRTCN